MHMQVDGGWSSCSIKRGGAAECTNGEGRSCCFWRSNQDHQGSKMEYHSGRLYQEVFTLVADLQYQREDIQ